MTDRRVVVCGECFSANLGDGLIAEAMQQMLGDLPDVHSVELMDLSGRRGYAASETAADADRPGGLRRLHRRLYARSYPYATALNLLKNRLFAGRGQQRRDTLAALSRCDHLIIGGGQLLRDSRLSFPAKLATLVELAATLDLPVSYFGVGAGERWTTLGRRYFRRALTAPNVRAIYCRDPLSAERVEQALPELSGRVATTCDAALGLEPADAGVAGDGVGLCIMNTTTIRWTEGDHALADDRAAVDFWVDLHAALAAHGMRVGLFTNGAPEDHALARRVEAGIRRRGGTVTLPDRPLHPAELLVQIRSFAAIIAFRLHANIAAYTVGVPSIGLAWDDKLEQFMDYSGQRDRFVDGTAAPQAIADRAVAALQLPPDAATRAALAVRVRRDLAAIFDNER